MVNDMFIREDLSRPENRINVAIFGMMTVSRFATWLLGEMGLPNGSVMYPPVNTANDGGAGRPDFVVRDGSTNDVIAYVEVECVRNQEQIDRFRRMFPGVPVVALWGTPGPGCDLSLQQIADYLREPGGWSSPQERLNASHLCALIDDALSGAKVSPGRATVGEEMWDSAFIHGLRRVLGSRLEKRLANQGALRAGDIGVDTTDTRDNGGFSVRVFSPRSGTGSKSSVSVLNRSGGRAEIRFSTRSWLLYYLPSHESVIDELARLVESMGGDMIQDWRAIGDGRPKGHTDTPIPLSLAEQHVAEIAALVGRLADRPARG